MEAHRFFADDCMTPLVSGAHFLATGELISLSEQQVVDCDAEVRLMEVQEMQTRGIC